MSSRYFDVVLPPPRQSKEKLEDVVQMSGQAPKAAGQQLALLLLPIVSFVFNLLEKIVRGIDRVSRNFKET